MNDIENICKAIKIIRDKHGKVKKSIKGIIECPICGKRLAYHIASINQHIWGACETEGCIKWIM